MGVNYFVLLFWNTLHIKSIYFAYGKTAEIWSNHHAGPQHRRHVDTVEKYTLTFLRPKKSTKINQ